MDESCRVALSPLINYSVLWLEVRLSASGSAAIEARRPVCAAFDAVVGRNNCARGFDLAAKIGRVECAVQDHFIDLPELGEREVSGEQLKGDVGVADLVLQPPE